MPYFLVKIRKGEVVLKSDMLKGADIEFFSDNGRKVYKRTNLTQDVLRLKNLKEGVYTYVVSKSGQSLRGRVVVP